MRRGPDRALRMENGISPTLTCGCSGKCIKVEQAFQSALWMTNALGQRCSRWDDALAATLRNSEWSTEQTTPRIGESYYPTFLAHNVTFESAWVTQISKDYTYIVVHASFSLSPSPRNRFSFYLCFRQNEREKFHYTHMYYRLSGRLCASLAPLGLWGGLVSQCGVREFTKPTFMTPFWTTLYSSWFAWCWKIPLWMTIQYSHIYSSEMSMMILGSANGKR